jgi:hypothetical protein
MRNPSKAGPLNVTTYCRVSLGPVQLLKQIFTLLFSLKYIYQSRLSVGKRKLTKNDAKCSDVMTALNPTTGTNAANNVPKTTCIEKAIIWTRTKRIHL